MQKSGTAPGLFSSATVTMPRRLLHPILRGEGPVSYTTDSLQAYRQRHTADVLIRV